MMKKIIALVLLITLVVVSTGFTKGDSDNSDTITLQFALWNKNLQPAFEAIAREYEKKLIHTGISINVINTPGAQYWTKMEASVTGGAAPDIFWMSAPKLLTYVKAGIIEPVTDLYTPEMKQNIAEVPRSLYTVRGEIWGIPLFYDTIGIFYNKNIFDTYGVAYPKEDWTWDDFITTLHALKKKMPEDNYPIALNVGAQKTIYPYISSAGGYVISDDKKSSGMNSLEVLDTYKKITQLFQEGLAVPVGTVTSEQNMATSLFSSKKVALLQSGVWLSAMVDDLDFAASVGTIELPAIQQKGNVTHALIAAAYSKSKHLKQAKEFLAFMASDFAYKTIAEYRVGLPANTGFSDVYMQSFKHIDIAPFVKAVEYSMLYPYSINTSKWDFELEQTSTAIFNGTKTPKKGLAEIYNNMQEALDKESY